MLTVDVKFEKVSSSILRLGWWRWITTIIVGNHYAKAKVYFPLAFADNQSSDQSQDLNNCYYYEPIEKFDDKRLVDYFI